MIERKIQICVCTMIESLLKIGVFMFVEKDQMATGINENSCVRRLGSRSCIIFKKYLQCSYTVYFLFKTIRKWSTRELSGLWRR